MNAHSAAQAFQATVLWSARRAVERGATARARRISGPHRPLPIIRGRGSRYVVLALVVASALH